MPATHLPTTRAFLTSLISSLPAPQSSTSSTNPLRDLPTSSNSRNTLLTLHVLFPTEFLPALDLLDRGLVTRYRIQVDANTGVKSGDKGPGTEKNDPDGLNDNKVDGNPQDDSLARRGDDNLGGDEIGGDYGALITEQATITTSATGVLDPDIEPKKEERSHIDQREEDDQGLIVYYVRSAQPKPTHQRSQSRFYDPSAVTYEVRLGAWNCSCPAFAFAAFPAASASPISATFPPATSIIPQEENMGGDGKVNDEPDWMFGGISNGIAVCKHLFACILAEKCPLFKGSVEEKMIGIEEAAGMAAGWAG
ncbi:hypothetical protein M501DRAFT_1015440 [Patellaria atrata CBS 101060]|uniref:SWIM-type domain-containing protein n=1 Tax=Patellaria atrata CBS 101060 TaxID=1346257 RepID=A0A9P4SD29_9PEZI|nr:hypothetical protein M501DRAFT_1015440 [Patellaria atrata CBS 101060]